MIAASDNSGITVRELVALPQLRTQVIAGHDGLDRRIGSAYIYDSRQPWDWLDPGDLVMTSGWIIPSDPADQVAFVERLKFEGLSGLVVGELAPDSPFVDPSPEMLEAADRLGFPILQTAYSVTYVHMMRAVTAANQGEETRSLNQIMRVHNEVRLSLMERRSSSELLVGLGQVLGCTLHLVDPELWEPVLPGCNIPADAWRVAVGAALSQRGGSVPTVMRVEVATQLALVIPVPVERSVFVLVVPNRDPGPRLAVLQHVAAACALELTRVDAGFERDRRSGAALLSEALHGRLDGKVLDSSLVDRGLKPPWVCVAINADQHGIDRLARRWAVTGIPHLLSGIGPICTGIIEADERLLDSLGELATADLYRIGVSDPFSGASGLIDGSRQARWALETIDQGEWTVARYGNDSDMFLPRTLSEARLAAERVLEPVLDYDRDHGTELIRTLQTYLECERSPKQAAKQLFIHNQTVNYRISRVEELTGRTMRSTGDISELWFGLRALALSESSGDDD